MFLVSIRATGFGLDFDHHSGSLPALQVHFTLVTQRDDLYSRD
jgi:hypothetical protein